MSLISRNTTNKKTVPIFPEKTHNPSNRPVLNRSLSPAVYSPSDASLWSPLRSWVRDGFARLISREPWQSCCKIDINNVTMMFLFRLRNSARLQCASFRRNLQRTIAERYVTTRENDQS